MSEEQVWVYHPGLDRWSQVAETSLDSWADLGWEFKPEGPPASELDERYSADELVKRAAELGQIAVVEPAMTPAVELAPDTAPETPEGVSIETPEPPASTTAAS